MKMLIVDDEYGSRVLLYEMLRGFGEIDIAVNGEEALTAFDMAWKENEPYKIIWLDMMMPEYNGSYVLKEIRKYERKIGLSELDGVIIIITSAVDDPKKIISVYKEGGVFDYLLKPIRKDQILGIINRIIKNG
ncbi:MAG: response regulator [Spirochaetales bacterium]|nr:response regulator [Spirochaetales bacterium]